MKNILNTIAAATFVIASATAASAGINYENSPYEVGLGGAQLQQDRNMTRADVPNFAVRNGQDLSRGLYDQN